MVRADVHVFGSESGYRTIVSSDGLQSVEARELHSFGLGDVSTSDAIARLESRPLMLARPLSSGRTAISRMLPAGVDDAGRPTIEVVSLVMDPAVIDRNLGVFRSLVEDVALWQEARRGAQQGFTIPAMECVAADPRDPALLRILDVWTFALQTRSIAVLPDSDLDALLLFVTALDPSDRRRCRWGVGINSLSAQVDICTIMPGTLMHGPRGAVRPKTDGEWYLPAIATMRFDSLRGAATWVPVSEILVAPEGNVDRTPLEAPHQSPLSDGGNSERRRRVLLVSIIAATCSTGLFASALTTYLVWSGAPSGASAAVADGAGASQTPNPASPTGSATEVFTTSVQGSGASLPPEEVLAEATKPPFRGSTTQDTVGSDGTTFSASPGGISKAQPAGTQPVPPALPRGLRPAPPASPPPGPSVDQPPVSPREVAPPPLPALGNQEHGAPVSVELAPPRRSGDAQRLGAFYAEIISLPRWQILDPNVEDRAAESSRVQRENKEALEQFYSIVWQLNLIDQDRRRSKTEQDGAANAGGFMSKGDDSGCTKNCEVLAEYVRVAAAAERWIGETGTGETHEERLKHLARALREEWIKKAAVEERRGLESRSGPFMEYVLKDDWTREVRHAKRLVEKCRKSDEKGR